MLNKFARKPVTLFCKYEDKMRNEYWKCVPLGEVIVADTRMLEASKHVDRNVDKIQIYMLDCEFCSVVAKNQTKYKSPREFANDPINGFTLQVGDKLVVGNVDISITSPKQLEKQYEYVYTISSVERAELINSRLTHWKVGAN